MPLAQLRTVAIPSTGLPATCRPAARGAGPQVGASAASRGASGGNRPAEEPPATGPDGSGRLRGPEGRCRGSPQTCGRAGGSGKESCRGDNRDGSALASRGAKTRVVSSMGPASPGPFHALGCLKEGVEGLPGIDLGGGEDPVGTPQLGAHFTGPKAGRFLGGRRFVGAGVPVHSVPVPREGEECFHGGGGDGTGRRGRDWSCGDPGEDTGRTRKWRVIAGPGSLQRKRSALG